MTNDYVEVYEDAAGEFRWRRRSANNEPIADSGEGYKTRSFCEEMARRVNGDVPLKRVGDDDE